MIKYWIFSTNINPFGASENVIAAAQSALKRDSSLSGQQVPHIG